MIKFEKFTEYKYTMKGCPTRSKLGSAQSEAAKITTLSLFYKQRSDLATSLCVAYNRNKLNVKKTT